MFATYSIAACEKNGHDFKKEAEDAVRCARDAIYGLLGQLCGELRDRQTLAEGDPWSEFAFYRARALLIFALMGIYWMWSEREGWKDPEHKLLVESVIPEQLPASIWGEAAVPHFLTYIWYRKRVAPAPALDQHIAFVLRDIMNNKLKEDAEHLAFPYYDIEAVSRHQFSGLLECEDPLEHGGFSSASYVCEALMVCLVRAGLKEACQLLWPNFTRMTHLKTIPDDAWRFALYRMGERAADDTKIYPRTMQWAELQEIANEHAGVEVPQQLRIDDLLLLLFVNVFPFRASFSALKFLDKKFSVAN